MAEARRQVVNLPAGFRIGTHFHVVRAYLTLIKHGDDYTLMPPYGGEPVHGFDVEGALESTPKMFRGGEAELELVQSCASGDMVFRREGPEWHLVHRHADPLVHAISMEQMAVLARGRN